MQKKNCSVHFLPAGQGDCFVIQFQDEKFNYHNILIDGGNRTALDFKKQKKQLLKIIDSGNRGRFDLVIVTHSDDDHIKGILNLIADDELEQYVEQYWFNSERSIAELLGHNYEHTQKYSVVKNNKGAVKSSRQQDNDLYSILQLSPKWDEKVITDKTILDISGLKITVLSPSLEKLKALNNYWPLQPLKKAGAVKSSGKEKCDYELSISQLRQRLVHFEQDASPVNGASIAILAEFSDFKWLFLSDSHPDVVVENLKKLNFSESNKIVLNALKISHHGSKKNTNDSLLEMIDCQNFVISANGNKKHFHPNKETLVRVLEHFDIEATSFHFVIKNSVIEKIFYKDPNIKTYYPKIKEEGIVFNYEC